jgi:CDP-diacylglycerol--glycerol-3-phosphate 3-phosphatidyltransferase
MIWNLPNRITLARLVLSAALFALLARVQAGAAARGALGWTAFAIFVLAAATDWVDGHLARRLGMVTPFGRVMDPFVDKVITGGTLVFLCALHPGAVPAWIVVVILAREFFVHTLRGYFEARGAGFAADQPGKIKMVLQCVAIAAVLLQMAVDSPDRGAPRWAHLIAQLSLWGALGMALLSAALYSLRARRLLRELR